MDWVRDSWHQSRIVPPRRDLRRLAFGQRTGRDTIEPSLPAGWHYSLFPSPGNVRKFAAVIERAAILGVGKRLEIARALGSPGRLSSPTPLPRREEASAAEPSLPTLDQAMARHIEYALSRTKGGSKAPTVPRPGSPSILIPSAPGCASSASIGEATGVKAALEPDRSEVPSATPLTQTVPAIATAQPHASEAHLVSLNSKAFSGSALTVAVSLELSSSRYLAEKGRLEDLPGRFGKLDSLISMRTL